MLHFVQLVCVFLASTTRLRREQPLKQLLVRGSKIAMKARQPPFDRTNLNNFMREVEHRGRYEPKIDCPYSSNDYNFKELNMLGMDLLSRNNVPLSKACFRVALDAYMDGLRHPSKAALDHNARFRVKHMRHTIASWNALNNQVSQLQAKNSRKMDSHQQQAEMYKLYKQTVSKYGTTLKDVEQPAQPKRPQRSMLTQRMDAWKSHNNEVKVERHKLFEEYQNGEI